MPCTNRLSIPIYYDADFPEKVSVLHEIIIFGCFIPLLLLETYHPQGVLPVKLHDRSDSCY